MGAAQERVKRVEDRKRMKMGYGAVTGDFDPVRYSGAFRAGQRAEFPRT